MKTMEKRIRQYTQDFAGSVDASRISPVIRASKAAYYARESEQLLSYPEFLYQQSRYIRKRWWVLQGGLLLLLWIVLKGADSDGGMQQCLGVAAPLFALLILPEIWKNRSNAAMEVECAAYYSLRQIYSARILLFGLVDLLLLSLFCLTAVRSAGVTAGAFLVHFLLPCNVTCCICFRTLCSRRIPSEPVALLLCMVWEAVWMFIVSREELYRAVALPVWMALLALSGVYLVYCVEKTRRKCETTWEVIPSWN